MSIYGTQGTPENIPRAPDVSIPLLEDIPFIGDIIGRMNILIWLGLLTVLLTWLVVFRTPMGLRLRSVGENPLAAQTAGVSPVRVRYVGGGGVGDAGGDRRRLPVDRLRRLVRREHDRGARASSRWPC